MSCRQKNKKKGKKPGGIKVSDVAGKKMINNKVHIFWEGHEMSNVNLTVTTYIGQIYGGDFAKSCGLLRIYELYLEFCPFFL